jgi:hypothetical protein
MFTTNYALFAIPQIFHQAVNSVCGQVYGPALRNKVDEGEGRLAVDWRFNRLLVVCRLRVLIVVFLYYRYLALAYHWYYLYSE